MQAQITQIRPLATFRRSQSLPVYGDVQVRAGQKVSVGDPLGEAIVATRHAIVDVTRALGLASAKEAEKLIDRKIGEHLEEKDIIAETGGMFSRVIRTPAPGMILAIQNGRVLIETQTDTVKVSANTPGTVVEVSGHQRIVIEANGTLVQGVWGNGKAGKGPLVNRAATPETALAPSHLDMQSRNAVVMAGCIMDESVLDLAASVPLAGLILGSMPANLIQAAERQPYPILLLEGFGSIPINPVAFSLLSTNTNRETSLNACKPDRLRGIRPEVVIALPAEGTGLREQVEFAPGQIVKATVYPLFGKTGVIERMIPGTALLPSGLRALAAEVKFSDEKQVIALSNLEIISMGSQLSGETE